MQTIVDIVIKLFLFKRAAIKNRNNSINQSSNVLQETGYKHDKSLKFVGTFMHYLTKKCFDLYQENIVKNYWHFWFKHRTHIISCVFLTRYSKRIIQFTQFLNSPKFERCFQVFLYMLTRHSNMFSFFFLCSTQKPFPHSSELLPATCWRRMSGRRWVAVWHLPEHVWVSHPRWNIARTVRPRLWCLLHL